ncbi:hypothetical protein EIP86_011255 [Pleurotus ostreatoroseus]|nr:hypothetical protein EIP86_011255 [Pleurotus ostreatoroseus]
MSGSPSLNPASTPFFPGGGGFGRDEDNRGPGFGLQRHINHDQFHSSSLSISPTDYRSNKSSPSPPQGDRDRFVGAVGEYHTAAEIARLSPAMNQLDNDRGSNIIQRPILRRDSSMSAIMEVPQDVEDTPGTASIINHVPFFQGMQTRMRDRLSTPPVAVDITSRTSSFNTVPTHIMSSSPASSLDSSSVFAASVDLSTSFDAQLRSSPFMREVLDRIAQQELTTREIQRNLGDVNRKLDMLVERSLAVNGPPANEPPEFRNPFASSATPSFSRSALNGINGSRASIAGNIAPNQAAPPEDVSLISHRLSSLSTSVDHLFAVQTQTQQLQSNSGLQTPLMTAPIAQQPDFIGRGVAQSLANVLPGLNNGISNRQEMRTTPRIPGPPMRTWSTGNLDIPIRTTDSPTGSLGRADTGFRDKRRSVTSLLRRDSAVTDTIPTTPRDSGPIISKWEQLSLAPDLLRSLSSFGVGPPNKIQQRALPFLLRGSDIIAQAPPTQERIAAYVIPAIHTALVNTTVQAPARGPLVVMISTTVDQATQAQRMIRDLGGPIGVRSALGVGAASSNSDLSQELRLLHQSMPHIICGTPQKLHALFTSPGGIPGSEVRFLVLDEVDQLIARNLHDFVLNIVKLLPPPRSRPLGGTPIIGGSSPSLYSSFDGNGSTSSLASSLRRMSTVASSPPELHSSTPPPIERQTALFSNTVPQDVLNLASAIQLREPVRVLVRRDGNVSHADSAQGTRGLRQFYLYLAFTAGGGRADSTLPGGGLGIIGSGRTASSAETAQAREWKLDALADIFDDLEVPQAIIHVGGMTALESVAYKLATRGMEAIPIHGDMNGGAKLAALNKFKSPMPGMMRQMPTKLLIVYDVVVKTPDVPQVPLIINYDLPKAVEEYAHRVAPAIAPNYSRAGVVINFVTATGGDVEMLRSIECFYKIKCPEVPMSLRDLVQ